MPLSVYREYFTSNIRTRAKAQTNPLSVSTKLYTDWELAADLHMTVEQFHKLPRRERRLQLFCKILSNKKEEHAYKEAKEKSERESRMERDTDSSVKPTRYRA